MIRSLLSSIRPKKLDIYLLKIYIGPFILTFFVALFVLVMQFLWKYIDDMIGKGIGYSVVFELLFYASASLAPLAIPLAILLSSIMTFGRLGEHFELTAAKASGISLIRFMRSLIFFSICTSIAAFLFSNYLLPKANMNYQLILSDVRRLKPTLNIKPHIFYNGIDNITMRVDSIGEDNPGLLYSIVLYDHSALKGNNNVLIAERGELLQTNDNQTLILKLYNGTQYQEKEPLLSYAEKFEFYRTHFNKWEKRIDLTQFQYKETDKSNAATQQYMMNLKQINAYIDTVRIKQKDAVRLTKEHIAQSTLILFCRDSVLTSKKTSFYSDIKSLPDSTRFNYYETAMAGARNVRSQLELTSKDIYYKDIDVLYYDVERQRKFTLSIACLVLFFVGAPLGAIIRKGGLGWPMFFSVILFIIFHVSGIIGEKMAKEQAISAFTGMWLSTIIFLPIGVFLTYKAKNDSKLFNYESYIMGLKKLLSFFSKKKS